VVEAKDMANLYNKTECEGEISRGGCAHVELPLHLEVRKVDLQEEEEEREEEKDESHRKSEHSFI